MAFRAAIVILQIVFFASCAPVPKKAILPNDPQIFRRDPVTEEAIERDWPFEVKAICFNFDGPPRMIKDMREQFLAPLANSRFSDRIERIEINADFCEYDQWTCAVYLAGNARPIFLNGSARFYDSKAQKHYAKASRTVLNALMQTTSH